VARDRPRRRGIRILLGALGALLLVFAVGAGLVYRLATRDPFVALFDENCSTCHGQELEGTALGPALVGARLVHGDSVAEIRRSIARGSPQRGMPAWADVLEPSLIKSLAILIAERRVDRRFTDFKVDAPLVVPRETQTSEQHDFRLEVVATGLDPLPFSIAPLPDGRILLTEKQRGLSIVDAQGRQSAPIADTPRTLDFGVQILGLEYGLGWMLDVALHPDYERNGWIYLHFGDLCDDCGEEVRDAWIPRTMNRLVRGRIEDGRWVDEQEIWRAAPETYTPTPDIAAGGRTALDPSGYVFVSVGMKGFSNHHGIQDLTLPYGKIHRVHDDGRIPADNPFVDAPGALPSIWTYGHRSPQGLEFDSETGRLWGTEMGPRGGDEVNLLLPGRNYGWPLYSLGVDYDGTPVEYGQDLGIEFELADIEQPVVDLTPSPAVSSFVVYRGDAFPDWRGDLIVGSLKATELYRIVLDGRQLVQREVLLRDLARIRDVEAGPDGAIYLLLEHASGGQIVRLVPAR
jgi:glucose/arabinose dehydrogenase